MGISFGKRKVKIKLLGQTEAVKEEEKQSEPVQTYRQEIIVSNPKPKVNRTFKEALKEITEQSKKLNLSDLTVVLVNSRADSFQTGNRTCRSTGVQKQACYSLSV